MPQLEQYLYTNLGALTWGREFKANVVICPLLRMPYSLQQYVLLKVPYQEQYLYTKLGKPIRGRENLTPVGSRRSQGKCGYHCLYGVEKILPQLEQIEFKANEIICALLRMLQQRKSCSSWSTQTSRQMRLSVLYSENALLRIAVCSAQARKCSYSEYGIRSRTCGYTELSEVLRPSYPECLTPNIGPIRKPALYKILVRLEQFDSLKFHLTLGLVYTEYEFNVKSQLLFFKQNVCQHCLLNTS